LEALGLHSPAAVDLVLFTGLQESGYRYIKQLGTGPALSFWQIEPTTAQDNFTNYLEYREELKDLVYDFMFFTEKKDHAIRDLRDIIAENLIGSLPFAVAMCRIKYRRDKMPLPAVGDGPGMARIWKQVYNTPQGAGRESEFINAWEKHKGELE
jgi:hypothetical protein